MALASLCANLSKRSGSTFSLNGTPHKLGFQAFVVDHSARIGSDTEASAVSEILEALGLCRMQIQSTQMLMFTGISTRILKIDWSTYSQPSNLSNFESVARALRFQTLGKACREFGISSLLLAHHEDDQVETVILRMIRGSGFSGLSGMKGRSEIPECYGLHGIHQSGGLPSHRAPYFLKEDIPRDFLTDEKSIFSNPRDSNGIPLSLDSETGGVKLYRPLLGFSKQRLKATCESESTTWFEDRTNQDPRVTARNAVRHMYSSYHMPAALSKCSILGVAKRVLTKKHQLETVASELLAESSPELNTCTGTLTLRFPDLSESKVAHGGLQFIAATLLRKALMLATPAEHIELSQLRLPVQHLFPELYQPGTTAAKPEAFNTAYLHFRPLPDLPGGDTKKPRWFISRQPLLRTETPALDFPLLETTLADPVWSPWKLYDGRFWIRMASSGAPSISIRPFRQEDLSDFKKSLGKEVRKLLDSLLSNIAPGKVRWTLPALVEVGEYGVERVVALPTLSTWSEGIRARVDWQVRYKKLSD